MKGKKWLAAHRIGAALLAAAMIATSVEPISLFAAETDEGVENSGSTDASTDSAVSATPFVSYDFDTVSGTAFSGAKIIDDYGTEAIAITDETFTLTERWSDSEHYLDLTGNKYLKVENEDGSSPLKGKDAVTIMYDSYYLGSGNSWAFYANREPSKKNEEGTDLYYFGIIEENSRIEKYAGGRSAGEGNSTENSMLLLPDEGKSLTKNEWKKVAVVVDESSITLYEDGEVVGSSINDQAMPLSELLGDNSVFLIGGSYWGGTPGECYNGYLDNFQIYDGALTKKQVADETARTEVPLLVDFDFEERDTTGTKFTCQGTIVTETPDPTPEVTPIPEATPTPEAGADPEDGTEGDIATAAVEVTTVAVTATANVRVSLWKEGEAAGISLGKVLDLRDETKRLFVTKEDGSPILAGLDQVTIVFDSFLESGFDGNQWPFYAAKNLDAQNVNDPNYVAMDENYTTYDVIRQTYNETGKTDIHLRTEGYQIYPPLDEWKNVVVVLDKENTYLYIDGELKDKHGSVWNLENLATIKDILGEEGGIFQLGRANWGTGEFYNGMLDNFQIYSGVLSETEVAALYEDGTAPAATKIADFTFDDMETGFSGAGAAVRPYLTYNADDDADRELYLPGGNKAYLNLLKSGVSPLKGKETITISFDSKSDSGDLNKGWMFYAAADTVKQEYEQEKYIGIMDKTTEVWAQYWHNKPSNFRLPSIGATALTAPSDWRHVDVVIDKDKTTLYVDGWRIDDINTYYPISTIIGENGGILQIGKANWENGEYFAGHIDNIKIYEEVIRPEVDSVSVVPTKDAVLVDADGKELSADTSYVNDGSMFVKVLAGQMKEYLTLTATLNGETKTIKPSEYTVDNYISKCGFQTVTLNYQGKSTTVNIYVYNVIESNQTALYDENGEQLFTIHSTWYDYLTDPEREGEGNYDSNGYLMHRDENGEIYSSDAEYVQFNKAIDNYWRNTVGLDIDGNDGTRYYPIYWGDFYSLNENYRDYDDDPNNNSNIDVYNYEPREGVSWSEYGQNFYGAVWGYNSHQYSKNAAQGIFDQNLKNVNGENVITIGGAATPYFEDVNGALEADAKGGDVYMNIYKDVLMPFKRLTNTDTGITYYEFFSGDAGRETIQITTDEDDTVKWVPKNETYDARYGYEDFDGVSFMPFNENGDTKEIADCGYAVRMDFNFYTTYDGKLQNQNDPTKREPIVFEFQGDDEFMFYIDGQLVLDIGGMHGECSGSINFADKTVTVGNIRKIETYEQATADGDFWASSPAESNVTKTFEELGITVDLSDPAQQHEAVIYYTERGKLEGNLKIRFNFPQENTVSVAKKVEMDVNPNLQAQMEEIIADEKFQFEVKSDHLNPETELLPITGETVAYHDGSGYTERTITNEKGIVEILDGESFLLVQRPAILAENETDEGEVEGEAGTEGEAETEGDTENQIVRPGFLDMDGGRLHVEELVNETALKKYDTSWILYDTAGSILGQGTGTQIDDNKSTYPRGMIQNIFEYGTGEKDFALLNLDAQTFHSADTGVEHINLSAIYTNTVRTNDITITKRLRTGETSDDTFLFKLTLSNLFGSGSAPEVYTGTYTIKGDENGTVYSAEDGYIRLKADQTAEITKIPALTEYLVEEDIAAINADENLEKDYQTIGSAQTNGVIDADNVVVDNVITNMEKNETEFYAWVGHGTTLPIVGAQALVDEDGNTLTDTSYENKGEYHVTLRTNEMAFTGEKYGNVLIQYIDINGALATATVHVYKPDSKAYVLDYGLPADLNQLGNDSLGVRFDSESGLYEIAGNQLKINSTNTKTEFLGLSTFNTPTDEFAGFRSRENKTNIDGVNGSLAWNDAAVTYTPSKFMESPDKFDYLVDVTAADFTDDLYTVQYPSEKGVRMSGNITVVPASIVYYEDDFDAITVTGTFEKDGASLDLTQSNDQDGVYGYDEAYGEIYDSAIDDDLILHYDFSTMQTAADGTTIADASGNGNTAKVVGAGATVSNNVLTLPGGYTVDNAAYIDLPESIFVGKEKITMSLWLQNETGNVNHAAMYVGNTNYSNNWPVQYWFFSGSNPNGVVKSVITSNGYQNDQGISGRSGVAGAATDKSWTLYTTVFDGYQITVYMNGVEIGRYTCTEKFSVLGDTLEAYIGKSHFSDFNGDPCYKGGIRDVRVYDDALSADRIAELYNETKMAGTLLLHYDFSQIATADADTTIPDMSGNHATTESVIKNTGATVSGDVLTLPGSDNGAGSAYVQMPRGLTDGKSALTISFWLNSQNGARNSAAMAISKNTTNYWLFNPTNPGRLLKSVITKGSYGDEYGISGNGKAENNIAGPVTTDGVWTYNTIVIKDNYIATYQNGELIGEVTTNVKLSDLGTDLEGFIGRSHYGDPYYKGSIRDMRIYDSALTKEEIDVLYNGYGEPTLDSAGGSTRLEAVSGPNRGKMTFTFTGTGFDIVGRSRLDTAGMSIVVRDSSNAVVHSQILDTSYANGSLYQLPLVSVNELPFGTYTVLIQAMVTQNRGDANIINNSVYIDGIRIYNPAAGNTAVTDNYLADERGAITPEIRDLLLGEVYFKDLYEVLGNSGIPEELDKIAAENGITEDNTTEDDSADEDNKVPTYSGEASTISLVKFDAASGNLSIYHGAHAQVENPKVDEEILENESLEHLLQRGPNNEVYLAKDNAIAFRAVPDKTVADRTLQIEAKKVADDDRGFAYIYSLTNRSGKEHQIIELDSYTPMYYEIDTSVCAVYPDGSYLVVLASEGNSMASLTNLKVKGYTLKAISDEDYSDTVTVVADTYDMMRVLSLGEEPGTGDEDPVVQPLPFVDVPEDSWYEPYVRYVYENNIMTGLDATHFGPVETLDRAQFATILYRMAGSPKAEYTGKFKDVEDGMFYTDAVMWASSEGVEIITGYENGCFGPTDLITREQIAVILYRYAKYNEEDVTAVSNMDEFPDADKVSAFAKEAVSWAVAEKLIQGDNGMINPQGNTNRAECATIIQRFLEK